MFCQDNYITIKGFAYATASFRKNDTTLVKNAVVKLRFKDSTITQLTSSSGQFSFKIKQAVFNATLEISTNNKTTSKEKYLCFFYPTRDENIIDLEKAQPIVIRNIRLNANELSHCIPGFATLFFNKNSFIPATAISHDTIPIDTAIGNLFTLLTDFPKMQIEIDGHADLAENDKLSLSNKRANYLAGKLISMGISKERLIVKSHGAKEPLPIIDKVFTEGSALPYTTDKQKLAQRNQRVAYRVLTWGFDDISGDDD